MGRRQKTVLEGFARVIIVILTKETTNSPELCLADRLPSGITLQWPTPELRRDSLVGLDLILLPLPRTILM